MASKDRKVLGTGLSALFGDLSPGTDEMTTLPLSRIEPREDQPRDVFEEDSLQSLADSISRYGLLQPITVRYQDSGYYQIIAGERRWRAARLAGLTEVPVRIIEADDRTTAELALVENLQREDLNPIEEARGYQSLIDDFGLTQEEAAKSVGKSRPVFLPTFFILLKRENCLPATQELLSLCRIPKASSSQQKKYCQKHSLSEKQKLLPRNFSTESKLPKQNHKSPIPRRLIMQKKLPFFSRKNLEEKSVWWKVKRAEK